MGFEKSAFSKENLNEEIHPFSNSGPHAGRLGMARVRSRAGRGEMPPPPPGALCDPYYYNCDYYNYYSAPYADPGTQFFYYTVPWVGEELEEQHERQEYRGHEHYEHRGHEGGHEGGHYERH